MKIVKLKNDDKLSHSSIEKNIISARLSEHYTKTITAHEIVPLGGVFDKTGNKLSIVNGKIVIGKGVKAVKISGQVGVVSAKSTGQMGFQIWRSGTVVLDTVRYNVQPYETVPFGTRLVSVTEGDYITLRVKGAIGDVISSATITYITIEIVD